MFVEDKLPVGSVDWLCCNLNEALNILFRQKHNLAHCSWIHVWVFLPQDTWDFPVREVNVAVLEAWLAVSSTWSMRGEGVLLRPRSANWQVFRWVIVVNSAPSHSHGGELLTTQALPDNVCPWSKSEPDWNVGWKDQISIHRHCENNFDWKKVYRRSDGRSLAEPNRTKNRFKGKPWGRSSLSHPILPFCFLFSLLMEAPCPPHLIRFFSALPLEGEPTISSALA